MTDTLVAPGGHETFTPGDLVMWHYKNGGQQIPVPGVVVRNEGDQVIIKARMQDRAQEIAVGFDQLVTR
jgi:ribosomal protein L35AE/L33A